MLSVISSEKELQGGIELPISAKNMRQISMFLTEHGVVLEEAPEEPKEAVKKGEKAMVLQICQNMENSF